MRFLVDADLPRSTARALRLEGHNAQHVYEVGLGSASDRAIFDYAQTTGVVLVTRDLDFTDPLQFPESRHHGLVIVRIRETLPPSFVNQSLVNTVGTLRADEFEKRRGHSRRESLSETHAVTSRFRRPLRVRNVSN